MLPVSVVNEAAIGPPITAANPWNNIKIPKAFVSFSKPIKSTAIIDLSAEKQAESERKNPIIQHYKQLRSHELADCYTKNCRIRKLILCSEVQTTENSGNTSDSNGHIVQMQCIDVIGAQYTAQNSSNCV